MQKSFSISSCQISFLHSAASSWMNTSLDTSDLSCWFSASSSATFLSREQNESLLEEVVRSCSISEVVGVETSSLRVFLEVIRFNKYLWISSWPLMPYYQWTLKLLIKLQILIRELHGNTHNSLSKRKRIPLPSSLVNILSLQLTYNLSYPHFNRTYPISSHSEDIKQSVILPALGSIKFFSIVLTPHLIKLTLFILILRLLMLIFPSICFDLLLQLGIQRRQVEFMPRVLMAVEGGTVETVLHLLLLTRELNLHTWGILILHGLAVRSFRLLDLVVLGMGCQLRQLCLVPFNADSFLVRFLLEVASLLMVIIHILDYGMVIPQLCFTSHTTQHHAFMILISIQLSLSSSIPTVPPHFLLSFSTNRLSTVSSIIPSPNSSIELDILVCTRNNF